MTEPTTRNRKPTTRKALGLIETLVAMGLLVMAIIPLMAMVVSAAASRDANEYATVATNLAREGIEVVVALRDSNWITDAAFDNGMYVANDYTFGLAFDPVASAWSFVNNPSGGAPNSFSDSLTKIYKYTATGLMVQGTVATPQPAGTVATPYRRLVTLDCICYTQATDTERIVTSGANCGADVKIGVRITSTAQWTDKGNTHNVSVVENIYDWR